MKQLWLDTKQCTGCGACSDICPKNAIEMKPDRCGFLYPTINENCIECNLCEKICTSRGQVSLVRNSQPDTFAAWSNDSDIRYYSTSGGVFSELALNILHNGGLVAGAKYNSENLVEHVIISNEDELTCIRQSKYIQSNSNGIYKLIKEQLFNNKVVLFCGAPCQVAALYAYLGKEYDKLITIDFICRGMNSPKAYISWLDEIEKSEGSKICRVWFKYKEGGWKSSPTRTRIDFEDGHYIIKAGKDNYFMYGYLTSNLYIRPSCGNCLFKGVPRQSDLTLADFWGIEAALDDDKGTSIVLINSQKGKILFNNVISSLSCYKKDFSSIFAGNKCFTDSVAIPTKSEAFLKFLDKYPFSTAIKKYTKPTLINRLRRSVSYRLHKGK